MARLMVSAKPQLFGGDGLMVMHRRTHSLYVFTAQFAGRSDWKKQGLSVAVMLKSEDDTLIGMLRFTQARDGKMSRRSHLVQVLGHLEARSAARLASAGVVDGGVSMGFEKDG
jgi:hypothetical protein